VRAVRLEHRALTGHHVGHRPAPQLLDAHLLGQGGEGAGALGIAGEPLGHEIDKVLARIRVLGKLGRLAERLAQPHVHGAREGLELIAGVVDVELALDGVALRAEDAREGVPHCRRPRVDDDERTRGVGGHELEEHACALSHPARPVGAAVGEDALERLRAPHGGEEHIQESRSRHLELHHHRALGEIRANRIGDLPRRLLGDAGQGEGGIRRVVSVRLLARHFPRDVLQCGQPGFVQGVLH